jgi:hypothetical protein
MIIIIIDFEVKEGTVLCLLEAVSWYFLGRLKVNFALEQAMKAQRECRGIALLFL